MYYLKACFFQSQLSEIAEKWRTNVDIATSTWDNGKMVVNRKFADMLKHNNITTAEKLWNIRSDPVKTEVKERGTERVFIEPAKGTDFVEGYIKRYHYIPMKKRVQQLVSFKKAYYDAFDEWESILAFHHHNIPTMEPIAVARYGRRTCVLTLGITNYIRASEVFHSFVSRDFQLKRDLIGGLANIAAKLHNANMSHQDFYLVHFFITGKYYENIYLIDLQRVVKEPSLALRWRIKDLAQLLFSARSYVNQTDLLFFWQVYTNMTDTEYFRNTKLIDAIFKKAERIRRHDSKKHQRQQQDSM